MPAKKIFKKKAKTSQRWLTKYKPTSSAIIPRAPGIGRSLKTRLETSFFYNATTAASGIFTGHLYPGSCNDPCGSLAAIQPAGFDQLKALFARYLVTGGYVEVEVSPSEATVTAQHPWVFSMAPSTVVTAFATYQGAAAQPYSKEGLIAFGESKKFTSRFNTQQMIGSRLPVVAEDSGALIAADPATGQNVVYNLFLQVSQAAAVSAVLRIKIVQDVIFDQRISVVDV